MHVPSLEMVDVGAEVKVIQQNIKCCCNDDTNRRDVNYESIVEGTPTLYFTVCTVVTVNCTTYEYN